MHSSKEYKCNQLYEAEKKRYRSCCNMIINASSKSASCTCAAQANHIFCCHSYERIGIRDASRLYSFLNIRSSKEENGNSNKCVYACNK